MSHVPTLTPEQGWQEKVRAKFMKKLLHLSSADEQD